MLQKQFVRTGERCHCDAARQCTTKRKQCTVCPVSCRWPWLIRTDIPPLLQYPLSTRSFAFVSGLIDLFYAPAWSTSLKGVRKVILAATAKS